MKKEGNISYGTSKGEYATSEEVELAKKMYQSDDLEIDDQAFVSRDTEENTGYWVAAWVWVERS